MDDRDSKQQDGNIMIVERRSQREKDLTSAEVMRILRRRAALRMRRPVDAGSDDDNSK